MAEQTGIGNNETTILATFKDQTATGIKQLTDRLKGVRDEAGKTSKSLSDIGSGGGPNVVDQSTRTLGLLGRTATLAAVGVSATAVALTGLQAIAKASKGDWDGATKNLKEFDYQLADIITSVPVAGQALTLLARKIHDLWTGDAIGKAEASAALAMQDSDRRVAAAKQEVEQLKAAREVRNRGLDEDLVKYKSLNEELDRLESQFKTSSLARDKYGNLTDAGKDMASAINQVKKEIDDLAAARKRLRSDRLDDIEAEKGVISGDAPNAKADLAFDRQQKQDQKDYITAHGTDGTANVGLEELQALQKYQKAEHDIANAVDQRTQAESKLGEKLADNAHLVETGSISIFEADRRTAAAQKEYEAAIEKTRQTLLALQAAATDPAIQQGIQKQIDALPPHVSAIQKELNKLGGEIHDSLQSPMEGFFKGTITGSMSVKQAFKSMVAGFADNLASLAANKLASGVLGSIFGGGAGSGAGGGLGGLIGGLFTSGATAKNAGGWIPGGGPDQDSVPAFLTPGEFVVRRSASSASAQLLHAINSGSLNDRMMGLANAGVRHFNMGGMVAPVDPGTGRRGGGGDGIHILPAFIMTPAEGRKAIYANKDAIFDLLRQHPERIPR